MASPRGYTARVSESAFHIREATPDDARAITELHIRSWRAAYKGLFSDERLAGLNVERGTASRAEFLRNMPTPRHRSWLLEEGDSLVGFATAGPSRDEDIDEDTLELYAVYVEPGRIGSGLGKRLMDHVLEHAREAGYAALMLWVLVGNERANHFYEQAGLAADARAALIPAEPDGPIKHRLVMTLPS